MIRTISLKPPAPASVGGQGSPGVSESTIQAAVITRLRSDGWGVIRMNGMSLKDSRGRYVPGYIIYGLGKAAGFPDVLALKGQRFLLVECKTTSGQLLPSQVRFRQWAARFGIVVHVVRDPAEMPAIMA